MVPSRLDARLASFFTRLLTPFLNRERGSRQRLYLLGGILGAILIAMTLAVVKLVVLKMLPFDNKSEFQVMVDMPVGTPLERTAALMRELGAVLQPIPEVTDYQAYAGVSSPINFNGLVRQYYLRESAELGDIQVNLVDKHHRDRKSHEIAQAVRPALERTRPEVRRRRAGRGSAAGSAGAFAHRGRGLRPGLRRTDRGRQAGAREIRRHEGYRRHHRHRGCDCAQAGAAGAAEQSGDVGCGPEGHRRDDAHGPVGRIRNAHSQRRVEVRDPGAL